MESPRLSYDECLERARTAHAQAMAAATPEAQAEYREIAKMWEGLCDNMRRNGLTHIVAP